MSDKIVDITVEIRAETDKAVQVYDGKVTVWLPRSQIEIDHDCAVGGSVNVVMPEWLAEERWLI
jgi:hypothetical protein